MNQGSFGTSPVPYSDSDDSDDDDDEDDGKLVPFEKAIMALFFAGFFMGIPMAVVPVWKCICSVCMLRILCATFGHVKHENGIPPLVLCITCPFARLQCFLFGAFPDFRPFLGPLKTPFSRL